MSLIRICIAKRMLRPKNVWHQFSWRKTKPILAAFVLQVRAFFFSDVSLTRSKHPSDRRAVTAAFFSPFFWIQRRAFFFSQPAKKVGWFFCLRKCFSRWGLKKNSCSDITFSFFFFFVVAMSLIIYTWW